VLCPRREACLTRPKRPIPYLTQKAEVAVDVQISAGELAQTDATETQQVIAWYGPFVVKLEERADCRGLADVRVLHPTFSFLHTCACRTPLYCDHTAPRPIRSVIHASTPPSPPYSVFLAHNQPSRAHTFARRSAFGRSMAY
jgi:hypothetical protein